MDTMGKKKLNVKKKHTFLLKGDCVRGVERGGLEGRKLQRGEDDEDFEDSKTRISKAWKDEKPRLRLRR